MQQDAMIEALLARIGDRLVVRPSESPNIFGWSKSTSFNMMARGKWPQLRQFGGENSKVTGWLTSEIIEELAKAPVSNRVGPRSPGRPKKAFAADPSADQRKQFIAEQHAKGITFAEIAKHLKISRAQVMQIAKEA